MGTYKTGVIVGKFYPPHNGHLYLINTGLIHCDKLVVFVCEKSGEAIPASLRLSWLEEIYRGLLIEFRLVNVDGYDEEDSQLWADLTIDWLGYRPEVAITSENYGVTWTQAMECDHIQVDLDRKAFPISGTEVRKNPLDYQTFLHPVVWSHFVKRVVVIGAESTGTTTLSKALAEHYETVWVPEYGRTYGEQFHTPNDEWFPAEFETIMVEQNRQEDELARIANKVLICDTDSFATDIWFEYYFNKRAMWLDDFWINRKYDLYIVTAPDIPFVQDDYGMRELRQTREWMHNRILSRLSDAGKPHKIVTGSVEQRMAQATKYIDKLLET